MNDRLDILAILDDQTPPQVVDAVIIELFKELYCLALEVFIDVSVAGKSLATLAMT